MMKRRENGRNLLPKKSLKNDVLLLLLIIHRSVTMLLQVPTHLLEVEEVRGVDFIALEAVNLLPFFQEEGLKIPCMNKALNPLLLHEEKCVQRTIKDEDPLHLP